MSDQMKQIAQRIRTLREISDYTVAEVAGFAGLTEADYESYESGAADIPISLLLKLSQFFNVDTTTILTGESPRLNVCAVTRKDKGVTIDRAKHYLYKNLAYNFTHRRIEPLLVTVVPGANSDMATNSHEGHDLNYVLEGRLRLKVGEQDMILEPGDSAYYASRNPHAMQAVGDEPCQFLAMVIP